MRDATRLLVLLLLLSAIAIEAIAQPQISYIIPDIGAEGMNTYVEIIAPVTAIGTFLPSTGDETIYSPQTISIKFLNPLDSDRVVVSPCVVSWEGRLLSCQFFVKPGAQTGAVPFRVVVDGQESNVDTFFIVQPQTFGVKSGGGVIGSGGGWGRRSKRGAMIVDSLVLRSGLYSIDVTTDPDPNTPGRQEFLPAIILGKGSIRIESGAVLDVSASGKNGGPGGGGGGGYGSGGTLLGLFPIPGERNTPLGFGYAGGKSNVTAAPSPATSFGEGTGASSRSLNGAEASNGFSPGFPTIRGYAAAPGHPFDRDGRSGGASAIVINTTTISFGQYYGGGGNGQKGQSTFPSTEDYLNGQIVGNRQGVPLHGGGGGSSGGPHDSVGAGGGGALAIYSQLGTTLLDARANGASGANGCANCGVASGNAAAGGAGGNIVVGGKLGLTIGTMQVAGGSPGRGAAPATTTGTESGSGGAGRFRHDGKTTSGTPTVTAGASRWVGPTIDTLTLVTSPLFNVSGTGLPRADIQVYVRGEDTPWDISRSYRTAVRPDSTWSVEVGFPSTDSLLYLFAVQTTPDTERDQTDEWTRVPSHVFSQAAANIIRYRPVPNLVAPKDFWADTIFCSTLSSSTFDTILIRNTGTAVLEFQNVNISGQGYFTLAKYPVSIPPGGTDAIIIQYAAIIPPGIHTANLEIYTNDPQPGKSPWIMQVHLFNAFRSYLDPDPDNAPVIDFGTVRVNSAFRQRAVIYNLNTVVATDVLIDSLWVKPPTVGIKTISRSVPKDTPIPSGDSLVVEVEYSPSQVEELTDVYLCARVAEPCLYTICWPLTGKGVASSIVTSKNLLSMQVPTCPSPNPVFDTVTVTNNRNTTITFSIIKATPKPPFTVVEPPSGALAIPSDSSKQIIVSYTPGSTPPPPGLLTIVANDATLSNIELNIEVSQGDEAAMSVSTDSISLTSTCPNMLSKTEIVFENTGSVVIDVTPAFASTTNQKFGIPLGTFQIPPGGSTQRDISFNSATKGVFYDTLFIVAEPCGLRDTIILRGEVTGAEYTVSPNPITFNNAPVGAVTQLAAQVTNDGTTPMRITGAQVIPSTLGISVSAFESFPKDVNPTAQASISIEFLPTTLGPIPAGTILEIYLDLPCKDTIRVVVGGEAIDADLVIQPRSLDFGGVLYCLSETDTVWAKNTAAGTIGIRSISVDPPNIGFSAVLDDPTLPFVQFGDSVAILITFAPSTAPDGLKSGVVNVETDNPTIGLVKVPVQGVRQTQSLQMTGGTFGLTFPGGTSQQTFTITNNGTGTVPILNLVVPPPFRIVATRPPLPRSLAPNATMEVDVEFAPPAALTYTDSIFVEAEGLTPCDSLYLPITATGEAVIIGETLWEDVTGEPGEVIMIPLKLKTDLSGAGVLSYSVDLTFNKTMLLPQRVIVEGTLSEGWNIVSTESDTGSISYTATSSTPLSDTGTLVYVETLVLLGNELTTDLASTSKSQFTTGGARFSITPGLFTLKGYCSVGGDRLVQITGNFGIKAVAPNPTRERIAVDFELVEDGRTRLTLYDALGREAYRFVEEDLGARSYRVESELDLPAGVYILELVTPTQREEVRVIVE